MSNLVAANVAVIIAVTFCVLMGALAVYQGALIAGARHTRSLPERWIMAPLCALLAALTVVVASG